MNNTTINSESELTLVRNKLLFVNDDKEKYGKSIVVEIKDEDEKTVNDWAKVNGLKDKDGNVLKVLKNEQYGYKYFYFRPNKATEYTDAAGREKLSFDDLTEDSTISLSAMAIPYEGKDAYGRVVNKTTYRLMAVVIHSSMSAIAKESAQRLIDRLSKTGTNDTDDGVDLSDVPF